MLSSHDGAETKLQSHAQIVMKLFSEDQWNKFRFAWVVKLVMEDTMLFLPLSKLVVEYLDSGAFNDEPMLSVFKPFSLQDMNRKLFDKYFYVIEYFNKIRDCSSEDRQLLYELSGEAKSIIDKIISATDTKYTFKSEYFEKIIELWFDENNIQDKKSVEKFLIEFSSMKENETRKQHLASFSKDHSVILPICKDPDDNLIMIHPALESFFYEKYVPDQVTFSDLMSDADLIESLGIRL